MVAPSFSNYANVGKLLKSTPHSSNLARGSNNTGCTQSLCGRCCPLDWSTFQAPFFWVLSSNARLMRPEIHFPSPLAAKNLRMKQASLIEHICLRQGHGNEAKAISFAFSPLPQAKKKSKCREVFTAKAMLIVLSASGCQQTVVYISLPMPDYSIVRVVPNPLIPVVITHRLSSFLRCCCDGLFQRYSRNVLS